MSSYDIAKKIRESLPGTEEILVQYLSGYLVDDASEDEAIPQVAVSIGVPHYGQARCLATHGLPHHTLTGSAHTQGEP